MKEKSVQYSLILSLLAVVSIGVTNILTNVNAQEDDDIETDSEISQMDPGFLTNDSLPLIDNQTNTSMLGLGETGIGEFDNFTTPPLGNESFDTGNESLPTDEESLPTDEESLPTDEESLPTDEESLPTNDLETEDELLDENVTAGTEVTQPLDNASESIIEDETDNLLQTGQALSPEIDQKLETTAEAVVGITNATGGVENEQITNVQQVINNIAIAGSQGGGDTNVIVNQISQLTINNPNGPVATSMKKLAQEYSNGNVDEIDIAVQQIGVQIAQGNNIEQTIVQITNNVINNINNVKLTIDNYDKIVIHPETSDDDRKIITETTTIIKKSKAVVVDVPRVHIKFENDERNLVLRVLSTNDAKYEMPFSKTKGAFTLDDDEFRVKVIGGKGNIQAASVAQMSSDGRVGDKEFLDKDKRGGKVYFDLDEIERGKYLLEVYIKLSDGSIGTWARGSISIS
jgi:hypothetical protein